MAEELQLPGASFLSLYDLLAKVLPGSALVVGLLWAHDLSLDTFTRAVGFTDSVGVYVAFLGLSFLAGVLLTAVAGAIFELGLQAVAKRFSSVSAFTAEKSWQRIDRIARRKAPAANVLAKIAAEVALCQNLLVGVLLIAATSRRPLSSGSVFIACAVLLFSWVTRVAALHHRIDSFERVWARQPNQPLQPTSGGESKVAAEKPVSAARG